jgi:hypothetical protein
MYTFLPFESLAELRSSLQLCRLVVVDSFSGNERRGFRQLNKGNAFAEGSKRWRANAVLWARVTGSSSNPCFISVLEERNCQSGGLRKDSAERHTDQYPSQLPHARVAARETTRLSTCRCGRRTGERRSDVSCDGVGRGWHFELIAWPRDALGDSVGAAVRKVSVKERWCERKALAAARHSACGKLMYLAR